MVLAVVATVAEDDSDSMHSADERVAARPVALPYAVVVAVEVVDYFDSVATALETTHQMTERTHRPNRDAEAAAWLIFTQRLIQRNVFDRFAPGRPSCPSLILPALRTLVLRL
jgi:hypothetical protein